MPRIMLESPILNSSLWLDPVKRNVWLTALLMAKPHEMPETAPQLDLESLAPNGLLVEPAFYGLIDAASEAIIQQSGMPEDLARIALKELNEPDPSNKIQEFEGRQLVRVPYGFIFLPYKHFRDPHHERVRLSRKRQKQTRAREKKDG